DRAEQPIGRTHAHLAATDLAIDAATPDADVYFLGLPHGAAAGIVPELLARGAAVVDLGPDFRLRDPADYPTWYGYEHPTPALLRRAVYGLPELHRAALVALRGTDGA